jgi:hypothetical protein
MSWSVSACGPSSKIAGQLEQQFSNINCSDPGEQETVQNVRALVAQTLTTIDPEKPVQVSASGSMGYRKWGAGLKHATEPHEGAFQSVDLKISPIHFSV